MSKLIKYIGENNDYHELEKNKLYFVKDEIEEDSCETIKGYGALYKNETYIDVSKEEIVNYIYNRLDSEIQEIQESIKNRDEYLMSNDPYYTFYEVDNKTQEILDMIHNEFPKLRDKLAFLKFLKQYMNNLINAVPKTMQYLVPKE